MRTEGDVTGLSNINYNVLVKLRVLLFLGPSTSICTVVLLFEIGNCATSSDIITSVKRNVVDNGGGRGLENEMIGKTFRSTPPMWFTKPRHKSERLKLSI